METSRLSWFDCEVGKEYTVIDEGIRRWIKQQRLFFVSTAPLDADGLINCSPKGMDTLRVLDERTIGYLDLTGSGVETIAHLRENGRIVIMMCAFEGAPKIIRFYGKGKVLRKDDAGYLGLIKQFEPFAGTRSIIRVEVERIIDSCGYSVPRYQYQGERDALLKWADTKGEGGVAEYQQLKNRRSLDGLDGL
jgi:hypothetical protein